MRDKRLFSVIIPAYNAEKEIERLFGSLITQEEYIHEIIVSNNGSSDKTVDIAEKYKKVLPIKILNTPEALGQSPGNARQYGLDNATGEWAVFADSDDLLAFSALKRFYYLIQNNERQFFISSSFDEISFCPYVFKQHLFDRHPWVHAKTFNIDYLKKHNIRFPKEIFTHEDKFFVNLTTAYLDAENIGYLVDDYTTYFWCRDRLDSIVSIGGNYPMTSYNESIYAFIKPFQIVKEKMDITTEAMREMYLYDFIYGICEMYQTTECIRFIYGEKDYEKYNILPGTKKAYKDISALIGINGEEVLNYVKNFPDILAQSNNDALRTMGDFIPSKTFYKFIADIET